MISVQGLSYSYNSDKRIQFQDFQILKGEHWLLLGESGSGKTTLLHLLGGLLRPQQGIIKVDDTNLIALSESRLDHFRGKNFGFVFQRNHLVSALSVMDNLLMAPFLTGLKQEKKRAVEVLEKLGLSENRNSKIKELSQGQAQRVAIARAVMNKPTVILADEPTSALDDTNCQRVIDLILEVANENRSTLVVATHDHRLKSKFKNQIQLG